MATLLGSLLVELGLESGQFKSGLSAAEKQLKATTKRFEKMGQDMVSLGSKLSIGLTAPLILFGKSAFKAASDAAELQSAFDQTFGAMSKSMTEWAKTTGDAMGRSTQEMQRGAQSFGMYFNEAAKTKEQAVEMSKTFTVLAQDLSSFFNVDPGVAIEKLMSGLAGQSEPLRAFGVFLTEGAVKAKAMEMGLVGANGELSEQAKIMARAQLIMEATTKAQGDVARTSGGTANQLRAAAAAWEELQVIVGTKLLPVLTPIITKIGELLTAFTKLPDGVQTTIIAIVGLSAALGPVLMALGGIVSVAAPVLAAMGGVSGIFLTLAGALKVVAAVAITVGRSLLALVATNPILLALAAAATAVYLIFDNWDAIKAVVMRVGAAIAAWWSGTVRPVLSAVASAAANVARFFANMAGSVIAGLRKLASVMVGFGRNIIEGLVRGIMAAPQAVWNALKGIILSGVNQAKALLGIKSPSRVFMEIGGNITDGLAIGIRRGIPAVEAALKAMSASAIKIGKNLGAKLRLNLAGIFGGESSPAMYGDAAVPGADIFKLGQKGIFGGSNPFEGLAAKLPGLEQKFTAFAARAADKWKFFTDFLRQSGTEAFDSVARNIEDVLLGVQSLGDAIRNVVRELASMALQKFVFAPLGASLGIPGFANGTNFAPGGLAVVGERGPELVNLPRGARVTPNSETSRMMAGASHNPTFVFPGVTNGAMAREAAGQAARRYRQEINGPMRGL